MLPSSSLPSRRHVLAGGLSAAALSLGAPRLGHASTDTDLVISSVWGPDKPFQKVVDAFNAKRLGVTATNRFDGDYQEAATKALASIAAGRGPDMMITGWKFGYFAKRTLGARDFHEIDAARADAILSNFVPSVHPLVTIDGALIGLPWAMSTPVTWINLDLWEQAGLDPDIPMDVTHDWLLEQAAAMDAALKSNGHATYRTPLDLSNNEWTSQAYIQNAGGYIIDPDGRVAVDSTEAAMGMTKYAQPARDGLWQPVDGRAQSAAFQSAALAINCTSSASAATFNALPFPVTARKFPRIGAGRKMNSGGNFLAIYARDDEKAKAAMTFLEFAASEEGQTIWSEVGYLNTSVHEVPRMKNQEAAAAQLADGLTAETIWPGERGLEAQNSWRQWVARILEGADPVEALPRARAEIAQLTS